MYGTNPGPKWINLWCNCQGQGHNVRDRDDGGWNVCPGRGDSERIKIIIESLFKNWKKTPKVFQHKRVCWQWTKLSQKCLTIVQEIPANEGESGQRPSK